MQKQKKKLNGQSKLTHVRSTQSIPNAKQQEIKEQTQQRNPMKPLGSLINEINELKMQLKEIKKSKQSAKKIKKVESCNLLEDAGFSFRNPNQLPDKFSKTVSPIIKKENLDQSGCQSVKEEKGGIESSFMSTKMTRKVELVPIHYPVKQQNMKLEIEINKLRQKINSEQCSAIANQTNEIFQLINNYNRDLLSKCRQQMSQMQAQHQAQLDKQKQHYKYLVKTNKVLEDDMRELKSKFVRAIEDIKQQRKFQQDTSFTNEKVQMRDKIEELIRDKQELLNEKKMLQTNIEELQLQHEQDEEQKSHYERCVEKKQQELLLLKEDVNYLRIESDKYKTQKKQLQKLNDKARAQMKGEIKKYQLQVAQLQGQVKKWQTECSLRRDESEQILAVEAQKNIILKELHELRNSYSIKCRELSQQKTLLHDQQKKLISYQAEVYRLGLENNKLQRSNHYFEDEVIKLSQQVEQLRRMNNQTRRNELILTGSIEQRKQKEEKMKALEDIHMMIRKHKEEIDLMK